MNSMHGADSRRIAFSLARALSLLVLAACAAAPRLPAQERDDEIVANLAAGRVIVHVARDGIVFATVEQAAEADSLAPRVVALDARHIGVLLGAVEWQIPAGAKPLRLEKGVPRLGGVEGLSPSQLADENTDLEMIGVAYLEALRKFAGRLHHRIELQPDEPLLQLVVIGYAPGGYGPEVWLYEYRAAQEALRGGYYQTRVLRPRTTQLYPPEKHAPRTLLEVRYPRDAAGATLQEKIEHNDLMIARLARSEPKFARVVEKIQAGKASAVALADAAEFLRAAVVPLVGKGRFAVGSWSENRGLDWLVPPAESLEKAREDQNRPPEAPTLLRKPKP
ncbi:MAG: hypothetical protein LAN84_15245 [Acidobacteriia bacterium]|nr:hypothetical protein [Terriglobia bacterium]